MLLIIITDSGKSVVVMVGDISMLVSMLEKISISREDEVNSSVEKTNVGKEISSIKAMDDKDGMIVVDTRSLKIEDGCRVEDSNKELVTTSMLNIDVGRSLYSSKLL